VPEPYDRILSLGKHCQGTYQIRRYTGNDRASYFDWLGIPHSGLLHELETDFKDSFQRDSLRTSADGLYVEDTTSGYIYRHQFSKVPGTQRIAPGAIDSEYELLRAKRAYLLERWKTCLRSGRLLVIRHDIVSAPEILKLYEAILKQARGAEIDLLVLRPEGLDDMVPHTNVFVEHGLPLPTDASNWKGSDDAWTHLLDAWVPNLKRKEIRVQEERQLLALSSTGVPGCAAQQEDLS
jgi:hypothetical protein